MKLKLRERELGELSEKALEIFEENLLKYEKFDDEKAKRIAKKWGFSDNVKIVREIDEICYQIGDSDEELKKSRFELGILDPDYKEYKNLGIHARIKFCVKEMLNVKINWDKLFAFKGILLEDDKGLRYLVAIGGDIDEKRLEANKYFLNEFITKDNEFAKKLKEVLSRYKIADLFLGKSEHIKTIQERIFIDQTFSYMQKYGINRIKKPLDGD